MCLEPACGVCDSQPEEMDLLTAELNRKRKEFSSSTNAGGGSAKGENGGTKKKSKKKKYVKRGEQARVEEQLKTAALEEKRRVLDAAIGSGGGGGVAADGDAGVVGNSSTSGSTAEEGVAAVVDLDEAEVKRRLRAMHEVVTYFGETAAQRFARMRECELAFRGKDDLRLGRGYDRGNLGDDGGGGGGIDDGGGGGGDGGEDGPESPPQQHARHRTGAAAAAAAGDGAWSSSSVAGGSSAGGAGGVGGADASSSSAGSALAGGGDEGKGASSAAAASDAAATVGMSAEDQEHHEGCRLIYRWCKEQIRQWTEQLAARPEEERRSGAGKMVTQTHKQCKDYIRPLFKMCKDDSLHDSIRMGLVKIINWCEVGEFSRAHDQYLLLAIGNAAWPIGVTMVGIHARGGRRSITTARGVAQQSFLRSTPCATQRRPEQRAEPDHSAHQHGGLLLLSWRPLQGRPLPGRVPGDLRHFGEAVA